MTDIPSEAPPPSALLDVIRLIESNPNISQRQVASSLGLSLGKANYCLRALIEKGLVKAENYRNSSNKRAYLYVLTPRGLAAKLELTRLFLSKKISEYERLHQEIEQLRRESEPASAQINDGETQLP